MSQPMKSHIRVVVHHFFQIFDTITFVQVKDTSEAPREGQRTMGNPGHAISTKPSKDEEQKEGHSWEGSLERSWDSIQEDEDGKLKINFEKDNEQKRRRMEIVKSVRKGLIRYLYVVIDLSRSMSSKDWKPTRCAVILEALRGT